MGDQQGQVRSGAAPDAPPGGAGRPLPRVLVLCDYFLPGFRAGGVLRSIANLLALLDGSFRFRVITRNRDYTVREPYPEVPTGRWVPHGRAQVRYLADAELRPALLGRLLRETGHDVLYLNSIFSRPFSMLPLALHRLARVPARPIVLCPNGELHPAALAIRASRKRLYLAGARLAGLHRGVLWRASDEQERAHIEARFGGGARVRVARNLPTPVPEGGAPPPREPKRAGRLRIVYLSRVGPIKNPLVGLEALRGLAGEISLDIYGPLDEVPYWESCQRVIAELPGNVAVRYHGAVAADRVLDTLRGHDLFLLPSRSESFGYAIPEALSVGVPVLISDRTPWRGLEQAGVGWDVPVDDVASYRRVLERCVAMEEAEHARLRERAVAYAREASRSEEFLAPFRALFAEAVSGVR